MVEVVNFKCNPSLIGPLLGQPEIFPACYMSKK